MPTHIDPTVAGPGAGTIGDPFKTIPGTLSAGEYLYKRGTTFAPSAASQAIQVGQSGSAGAEIIIGAYGEGPDPIINCANVTRGINISTDVHHIIVRDLRITGVGANTARRGIANATTASSEAVDTSITIERVTVDNVLTDDANDCNGIQLFGANNTIQDCTIEDIATDGAWYKGDNFQFLRNTVRRISKDGRGNGDCLQCGGASDNGRIIDNTLDHSDVDAKQCYIHNTASAGLVFEGNTCIGYPSASFTTVYVQNVTGAVIRWNVLTGGANLHILASGASAKVYGNTVDNPFGRAIDANADDVEVYNNTCVGALLASVYGIRHNNTGNTGVLIRNNLLVGWDRGISATTGATHASNAYWQCTTNSSGGTASGGDVTADPLLTGYRPKPGSPLLTDGADLGLVRDIEGRQARGFIGAYAAAALRATA